MGKTTLVQQVSEAAKVTVRYASADEPTLRGADWIAQQWEAARLTAGPAGAILVLDEVQKAVNWSESVKRLWDEDTRARRPLKVVLLGSAPLLVQRGLTESLAGRFEVLHLPHWSLTEMRTAFDVSVEEYVYFGGYPGAASLLREPARWRRYILDALVETTLARDVLLLTRVDKPALLRRLFELGCRYSGQVLSYSKMLGQLHENKPVLRSGVWCVRSRPVEQHPKIRDDDLTLFFWNDSRDGLLDLRDKFFRFLDSQSGRGAHLDRELSGISLREKFGAD